jgi:type VI secretion system protein ImpF
MARPDPDQPLLPSVLDRLIDDDPAARRDPPRTRGQNLAELRRAVGRDLEALLNTRQRCKSPPDDLTELEVSLVNYGIPDFTGANLATEEQRDAFRRAIEDAIRRLEPRFQQVAVTMLDNTEPLDRTLRFRIEALMHAEPLPEAMVFDSLMEPVTRSFAVTSLGDG